MKDMMGETNRDQFKFGVAALALIEKCATKSAMHAGRIEHWMAEHKRASEGLAEIGPVAMENFFTQSTRIAPSPTQTDLDKALMARRLTEDRDRSAAKVNEHKQAKERIEKFKHAFELFPDKELELTVDDIWYFQL